MTGQVPGYGYVLVVRRENPKQTQQMRRFGHSRQRRGIRVSMLSL